MLNRKKNLNFAIFDRNNLTLTSKYRRFNELNELINFNEVVDSNFQVATTKILKMII